MTTTTTPTTMPPARAVRRCALVLAALAGAAALLAAPSHAASGIDRITTVAGSGTIGYAGDGGQATSARLDYPVAGTVDAAGNLYIADDDNQRLREVTAAGVITTVAGIGVAGAAGNGGQATSAELDYPTGVAVDPHGDIYVADAGGDRVQKISPSGVITTFAGTGVAGFSGDGGPATAAELDFPASVAVAPNGGVYIADALNERVREVLPNGTIVTVAGTGTVGFSGDGGQATSAELATPISVATDSRGDLFIADHANNRVREVSTAGTITTVAGDGVMGFSGDGGQATSAELSQPQSIAVDPGGNLYIADLGNYRIRKVSPSGTITTIAGNGTAGFTGDGGQASSATLEDAYGVATDQNGDVYVFDTANARVREIANVPPSASFTSTPAPSNPLQLSVDASASTDPDGAITAYSWNFGDGTSGSGEQTTHAYAKAGTYTITLTVTDDSGASSSTSSSVTVQAPPAPPSSPTPAPAPPASTPAPPVINTSGLAMTVFAPSHEHVLSAGAVTLEAACNLACSVSTSGRLDLPHARFALSLAKVSIHAGEQKTIRVALGAHLRTEIARALKNRHTPVVALTLRATHAGDPTVRTLRIAIVG